MIPIRSALRSPWRVVAACLVAMLVVACGGGVDTGGTGAQVSTFSAGRISGLGSIIVNGVRFDDSAATIVDDDDVPHGRDALKLGMTVDVQAGPISAGASVASRIQFGSAIKGAVESVDATGGTLRILGQTVNVDADTVLDGISGGIAGIHAGDLLEVFAFFDATTGTFDATRIERETSLAAFKLRGRIASLNTGAKTFAIGGATISYAAIPPGQLPTLAVGLQVHVELQTTQQSGVWVATEVRTAQRNFPRDEQAEVEDFITDFASTASFKVGGIPVDASGAGVVFKRGTAADLKNGVRVEVEGSIVDGVLVATKVDFKKKGGGEDEFELHGPIESVNAGAQSFVLRGITVVWNGATRFDGIAVGDLQVGARVEVEGVLSGGNQLLATRIRFDR